MAAAATGRGVQRSERYKERLGAAPPRAFLIEPRFSGQIPPSISHILKSNKPTERRVGGRARVDEGVWEAGLARGLRSFTVAVLRAARNKQAEEAETPALCWRRKGSKLGRGGGGVGTTPSSPLRSPSTRSEAAVTAPVAL